MSITDELRKWGRATLMPSLLNSLLSIADRIDAEHERQLGVLYRDMSDAEWVRLPKDADGVPINVGDVMELVSYDEDYRPVIRTVNAVGEQVFFAWSKENGRYAQYEACAYRHHAPTVEEVLREFALAVCKDDALTIRKDVVDEYAKRLTLAETEDA